MWSVLRVCVCRPNKATPPPAKGNFDDYRFDLTKLTPPPQLKFHRCIPSHYTFPAKGNFDDYRFDLTKLSPPLPAKVSQVHTIMLHLPPPPKFHGCVPSHYTCPPPKFHECIPSHYTYPPANISWLHTPPPHQNFMDAFHHLHLSC